MSTSKAVAAVPYVGAEAEGEVSVLDRQSAFVRELQLGDEAAFERLVVEYERPIARFLYRYLGNAEEAKEVCQDVFVKIFRGISNFQNNCSLRTWIYRITLNTVLNEKRKWYHRMKDRFLNLDDGAAHNYASNQPDPELSLTLSDRSRAISVALKKLKPDHRAILVLRDLEGLSYDEIAEALDVSLGTVKSRLARARQEMKHAVQAHI